MPVQDVSRMTSVQCPLAVTGMLQKFGLLVSEVDQSACWRILGLWLDIFFQPNLDFFVLPLVLAVFMKLYRVLIILPFIQ